MSITALIVREGWAAHDDRAIDLHLVNFGGMCDLSRLGICTRLDGFRMPLTCGTIV